MLRRAAWSPPPGEGEAARALLVSAASPDARAAWSRGGPPFSVPLHGFTWWLPLVAFCVPSGMSIWQPQDTAGGPEMTPWNLLVVQQLSA